MSDPVLHLLAGTNGAGKSTFYANVLAPSSMEYVNADEIAAQHWPGEEMDRAYDAAKMAARRREALIAQRSSFVTETVFSHESKVELVRQASLCGYIVILYIILVPEDLAVLRVQIRSEGGGHDVPEAKIRSRHQRLWAHVSQAIDVAEQAHVYDNSSASVPFREVAFYRYGIPTYPPEWPSWAPDELRER